MDFARIYITGVDGIVVSANRNPQKAYIHFNTNGNKHTITFRSKNEPTPAISKNVV